MLFCSVVKLLSIGTVVVSTFALCWLPWTIEPRYWQQVLKRIFPVDRGLYEVRTLKLFHYGYYVFTWPHYGWVERIHNMCYVCMFFRTKLLICGAV